jgi:hypothetical protein
MSQPSEQFERQIAEFVDGSLEEPTRSDIENCLLTDAEARLLATQYAHLNAALRGSRLEPAIDFDQLAGQISAAIDAEDAHVAAPMKLPTAVVHRSVWWKRTAVAALAMIAATSAAILLSGRGDGGGPASTGGELLVTGPTIETPKGSPQMDIAIGPSKLLVDRGMTAGLTDEIIVKRPPRVVISAAADAAPAPAPHDERLY